RQAVGAAGVDDDVGGAAALDEPDLVLDVAGAGRLGHLGGEDAVDRVSGDAIGAKDVAAATPGALDVADNHGLAARAGEVPAAPVLDVGARLDRQLDEHVAVGDEGEVAAGEDDASARAAAAAEGDGFVEPEVAAPKAAVLEEAVERRVGVAEDNAAA